MPVNKTRRRAERRRLPRADAKLSMRVESREESTAQIVTESQNISASGVYCNSPHYLAPMSKVALTIVLPRLPGHSHAQELVKCEGIVVRCEALAKRGDRPFELACMFTGLEGKRRILIDDFVTWRNLQALRAATAGAVRPRTRTAARATRKTATRKTTRRPAASGAPVRPRRAVAARSRSATR